MDNIPLAFLTISLLNISTTKTYFWMRCFTWNTAFCTPKYVIWLFMLFITFVFFFITYGVGLDVVLGVHFCFHGTIVIHEYCLKENGIWILALLLSVQVRSVADPTTQPSAYIHHSGIHFSSLKVEPKLISFGVNEARKSVWGGILAPKTSPAHFYYLAGTSI